MRESIKKLWMYVVKPLAVNYRTVLYNVWMDEGQACRTVPSPQYVVVAFPQK
jgi:hypothetical protein